MAELQEVPDGFFADQAKQLSLRPAIKLPDGTVKIGDVGETHNSIGAAQLDDPTPAEDTRGFVDDKGNFLDRKQAGEIAKANGVKFDGDELHSEHLAKAEGKPVLVPVEDDFFKTQPSGFAKATLPKFDVAGDIGRAASSSATAFGQDFNKAFPSGEDMAKEITSGVEGQVGGALERGVALAKLPWDALGILTSPVTGLAHATVGSAMAKGMEGLVGGDQKAWADSLIDQSLMGLGPKGGIAGAVEEAQANPLAKIARDAEGAAQAAGASPREAIRAGQEATHSYITQGKTESRALDVVNRRAAEDNLTAQSVMDAQERAKESGDKTVLADLGKNSRNLLADVYKLGGEPARGVDEFFDKRNSEAGNLLLDDVKKSIGDGSTYHTINDLQTARSEASKPVWTQAMDSRGIAPVEQQFTTYFNKIDRVAVQAAQRLNQIEQATTAQAGKISQTQGVNGLRQAQQRVQQARGLVDDLQAKKEEVRSILKQAQADGSANLPGAVWSPKLQEFLTDPDIKAGIRRGIALEKKEALGKRPFRDRDYAITGYDENGDPVLGAVPTMKSLAVAKEGLDAIISDQYYKDGPNRGRPTKEGFANIDLRAKFLKELDLLNPKYADARRVWSGPTQSAQAVQDGLHHFDKNANLDELKHEFGQLTPGDKEFYRLGAAEAVIKRIKSAGRMEEVGKGAKATVRNQEDIDRFKILFDNSEDAQRFLESVERRGEGAETAKAVTKSAQGAKQEEKESAATARALSSGLWGVAHAVHGNTLGALSNLVRARSAYGFRSDPALNEAISKILTDPDLAQNYQLQGGADFLRQMNMPETKSVLSRILKGTAGVSSLSQMAKQGQQQNGVQNANQ